MRTVLTITAKDLRQRLRDRSVLLIAFVVPVGLAFVFSLVFGDLAQGSLGDLRVGTVDLDRGEVGRGLVDQFLPAAAAGIGGDGTSLELESIGDPQVARDRVERGELDAALILPAGSSAGVRANRPVTLEVVTSAEEPIAGQVATAIADQYLTRVRARQGVQLTVERLGIPEEAREDLVDATGTVTSRVRLDVSTATESTLETSAYLAAGMAALFVFFTVQFGVLGYLEERRAGTLQRLLSAPIPRWSVAAAKSLTSFVVGVLSVGALLGASVPLFGVSWGDPVAVAALVVAVVIAATSLVLVVVAFARTPEQANVWQSIIAIVLGLLGGSFFPISGGPAVLQVLSDITPHAWFLRGLGTLSGGGSLVDVVPSLLAMLGFAAALVPAGLVALRTGGGAR